MHHHKQMSSFNNDKQPPFPSFANQLFCTLYPFLINTVDGKILQYHVQLHLHYFIQQSQEKRKISLNELSEKVGLTLANLSILKTGKAKAVRFSTLETICKVLNCQPGDILEYVDDQTN